MQEEALLARLRRMEAADRFGQPRKPSDGLVAEEWRRSGVKFASSSPKFEAVYEAAMRRLLECIVPAGVGGSMDAGTGESSGDGAGERLEGRGDAGAGVGESEGDGVGGRGADAGAGMGAGEVAGTDADAGAGAGVGDAVGAHSGSGVHRLGERPVLHEGGVYRGCWLESTGTINAELLARFVPSVSEATYRLFADYQRDDGLMPYKVTEHGPVYRQIQMVTPLARCVWHYYALHGRRDKAFLLHMYGAMKRFDEWLAAYRNTRGTGGVEAFATFDTGHDLSPRFWHVPDTPHNGDARYCNPDSPILPFVAPDLTANVMCQRTYLARMAEELELGEEVAAAWRAKAAQSERSLFEACYDAGDGFFYDLDRSGQFVRVQSDVLLRVLACEVGDRRFFDAALRRYLLNTSKFFAKYPFTSIAMDDPRFDPSSSYNTWAGTSNFLSLIRAPHAFEHHGRYVELTWVLQAIMAAMNRMTRFGQTLSPWTGAEGYTESYSPAILCVLDYVERLSGILPTADGELWFTGLTPYPSDHGEEIAGGTAYARTVDGREFELVNSGEQSAVYRDRREHIRFPAGVRVVTDRTGALQAVVGMSVRTVQGVVRYEGGEYSIAVKGNERLELQGGRFVSTADIGVVMPSYR